MRKKFSSIMAVMLSMTIGFTGIGSATIVNAEEDAWLESSVKEMSTEAENKQVYFYYNTMEESDNFKLYENGVEVGTFVDDGKYSISGDDIMGDGVYTLKYEIDTDTIPEGSKYFDNVYNVRYGVSNTIVSDDETITIYKPFTQQELDDMAKVDEEVKKLIESDEYAASSLEERKVIVTELLNSLAEQGLVKSNFTFSNTVAGFEYSCGVQGGIMLKGWDEYEEPIDSPAVTTAVTTEPVETITITTVTTTTTTETIHPVGDANGDNEVNVRDCACIALALAAGKGDTIPMSADFNSDGKVDVRDAAAIATMLANKNSMESWEYAYNSLINGKSSNTERSYSFVYIDEDDVPELIVTDIGDNRDGGVYTYKNGILNELEGISLRNNIYGYSEKSGIFAMKWLWLEQAGYNFYKLENGAIEKVHEFVTVLTTEGEAESFSVDGQNVTEEEYNQLYEEYSSDFKDVAYFGYDEIQSQLN